MEKLLDSITEFLARFLPDGIMKYVRKFLSAEFILFAVIGVINTFNTAVIAMLFDFVKERLFGGSSQMYILFEKYNVSFIAAYIISLVISFFLNTCITFRERPTWGKFIKFPVSYIPNFIIQYLCVWVFTRLAWSNTAAYLTAAVIGVPVTFITMRIFVYKKK